MAGYAGRSFPSLAVHDPLWARALVLDDGERRAAMVALDLIGISEDQMAEVREAAAGSAGIAPEGLLAAGSHTHSGPRRGGEEATEEENEYWKTVPGKIVAALEEAAEGLAPARMGAGSGWSAVGINRREMLPGGRVQLGRNHFGHFDSELGVVRIERADGTPLAAVLNYACHGICLQQDNYLLSADYPGPTRHFFERRVGDGVTAMFFNGACGDVNPREAGVGHGLASGGGFGIAERAGRDLAREGAKVWRAIEPTDEVKLSFANKRIELPTNRARALRAAEEGLKQAERAAAEPQEEWSPYEAWWAPPDPEEARKRVARLKEEGDAPVRCEIQAISTGPVTFVAWPGEIFSQLGVMAKQGSPFRPTYVIGYANGSIGYVPTPEAFPEGGYEVDCAVHLADNAGLVLVEESLALLTSLKR
jgi:hypothetical protein